MAGSGLNRTSVETESHLRSFEVNNHKRASSDLIMLLFVLFSDMVVKFDTFENRIGKVIKEF